MEMAAYVVCTLKPPCTCGSRSRQRPASIVHVPPSMPARTIDGEAASDRPIYSPSLFFSWSPALFCVSQCFGVRDTNRCAVRISDQCFQRIGVEGRQRLARYIAQMRTDGNVIHGTEWMVGRRRFEIEDIDTRAREAAGAQRRDKIGLDHDRPARGVDQISLTLHQSELARRHQAASTVAQLNVDRENVGQAKQIVLLDASRSARRRGLIG